MPAPQKHTELMGSSNRGPSCKLFFRAGSYAGCRVVFAVGSRRRIMGLRGRSLPVWTTHYAVKAVHPIKRNGRPTSRQGHTRASVLWTQPDIRSGHSSRGAVEHFAGPQHCVHGNRQLPGNRDGSPFEANPLSQIEPPRA